MDQGSFYSIFDRYCLDERGNYQGSSFSIEEIHIDRRKTDREQGTDEVYATISATNENSKYIGEFHLSYVLYDIGGWYLENIEEESGEYQPLSHVPDELPISRALSFLGDSGPTEENLSIIDRVNPVPSEEIITVEVKYSDSIFVMEGTVTIAYFEDGGGWRFGDMYDNLAYDIQADGTYYCPKIFGWPAFLIVNHEDGVPVIQRASTWMGDVEGVFVVDGYFDFAQSAFIFDGGQYVFEEDGMLYIQQCYSDGTAYATYNWVAEPITSQADLQTFFDENR